MNKPSSDEGQRPLWETTIPEARVTPLVKRASARDDRLWGIDELARYLGVPKYTIYGWRKTGYGPPAIKVGKHLRWRPEAVRVWLRQREASA